MNKTAKIVGYLTIGANDLRNESFETASWRREHRLTPGEYPIYEGIAYGSGDIIEHKVSVPTVIESDYFPSSFCGNLIGKPYDTTQNKGRTGTWVFSARPSYAYGYSNVFGPHEKIRWLSTQEEEKEVQMFGQTIAEMRSEPLFANLNDPFDLVAYSNSILSDAQEAMVRGQVDIARQFINKAKYFNDQAKSILRKAS